MTEPHDDLDPRQVARELNRCRQHGLDDLDLNLHHKPPVPEAEIAHLHHLARAYGTAIGRATPERAVAIRQLLRDGLAAYNQVDTSDSAFVRQFFFDQSAAAASGDDRPASGSSLAAPKKRPLQKDLARALGISEKRLAELRDAAFVRFATFLIGFVIDQFAPFVVDFAVDAMHRAGARQSPPDLPLSAPEADPPPVPTEPLDRQPVPWVKVALVGLIMAGVIVARLLGGLLASPGHAAVGPTAPATTAYGYVTCSPDTTKAVEGVWVDAPGGGSGWADWHALPGQPNVAYFSLTLPHGGQYFVHVGCGGSPQHWDLAVDSVNAVLGEGYHFTCYDTFTSENPSSGQCQP